MQMADAWGAGRPWQWLALVSILVILLATTWPWTDFRGHAHWAKVEWVPFTHRVVWRDLLVNVLLFLPLGFTARKAWPTLPAWRIVTAAALLSCTVETYQFFSHRRFPTTIDVLANAAGTWLGLWRAEHPEGARRMWQP